MKALPLLGLLSALIFSLSGGGRAEAALECFSRIEPYRGERIRSPMSPRDCPSVVLLTAFEQTPPPPRYAIQIIGYHKQVRHDAPSPEAVVEFRLVPPGGHGYGPNHRVCPNPASQADMQIHFAFDPARRRWDPIDSRGSTDPGTLCDTVDYWSSDDIERLLDVSSVSRPDPPESRDVHDVSKGTTERRQLLDAVREANADLNDLVPIVFLVERLRSDGRHAYFRGQVRQKKDGRPVDRRIWGPCEQEPEDAVLEALLEKRHGIWTAIKANRCADDVLFSEEELARYGRLIGAD